MEAVFSDAYARIKKVTGYTSQAELAQRLGIPQALISDSRRRGEVNPEILLALLEQFNLAPQWVRTGEGDRHFITSVNKVASLYGMKILSASWKGETLAHLRPASPWDRSPRPDEPAARMNSSAGAYLRKA